jgi:pyruvate dehydrogenase E2 component (dihydrolipoamide acetyltransferase)
MAEFTLPDLGEDVDEADVLKVLVAEGDSVTLEQPILEIETEKATLDVPSSVAGTVTAIHVSEGDTIHPGQLILTVSEVAAASGAPSPPPEAPAAEPAPAAEAPAAEVAPEPAPAAVPEAEEAAAAEETRAEPEPERPRAAAVGIEAAPPAVGTEDGRPIFASPAVRKFAREIGVDLGEVTGSGPGGRISEEDVKTHARGLLSRRAAPASAPAAVGEGSGVVGGPALYDPRPLPDFAQFGAVRREKLTRLRRTVARNMTNSWVEIPHVTLQRTADITEMEQLRQRYKEDARAAGGNLTISVFVLKILAGALKAHPLLGTSLDVETQELIYKDYVHIGVAVDTDRGLVVPAIRDVDEKNIIQLSVELNQLAERARTNELTLDDSRGGMFTLTNLGSLGTGFFSPVINPPEVGVLGVGRAQWTPVLDGDKEWQPRLLMPLSLSHDHRVVDGADGARFMQWIIDAIDNPMLLALEG